MFGSIGPTELILIFIIALLVFGPKKLPDIGKSVGKALREFKKASDEIKGRIEEEIQASEIKDVHRDIQSGMNSLRDGMRDIAKVTGVTDLKNEIRSATDFKASPARSDQPESGGGPATATAPDPYAQPATGTAESAPAPIDATVDQPGGVTDSYSQPTPSIGETPSAQASAPGPKSTTAKRPRAQRSVAKTSPRKSSQKLARGPRKPLTLAKSSPRTSSQKHDSGPGPLERTSGRRKPPKPRKRRNSGRSPLAKSSGLSKRRN